MLENNVVRRFITVCGALLTLTILGTTGYAWLEGWSFSDGLFMTIITLSTVGYGETHALTEVGQTFTIALIAACLVTTTCWTAALTSFLIENDLSGHFTRRRTKKMIDKLTQHTVVCGSGQMAQAVIERLMPKRVPVVLVDDDTNTIESLRRRFRRLLVVEGKGTDELTLAKASVLTAKNVIAATNNEVDNLLIAITCKDLNSRISVIAHSNDATIANRMRKAGVDEIVSPIQLCGDRVADLILA